MLTLLLHCSDHILAYTRCNFLAILHESKGFRFRVFGIITPVVRVHNQSKTAYFYVTKAGQIAVIGHIDMHYMELG